MIDHDRLYEHGELPVACGLCGWCNGGRLVLVDRYSTDFPPGPRGDGESFIQAYRQTGGDPDDVIGECSDCGTPFDRDSCEER